MQILMRGMTVRSCAGQIDSGLFADLWKVWPRRPIVIDEEKGLVAAFPLFIQNGEVRRVGDNKSSPVNVRVVGATNEALLPKLKAGTFREDLYYRLAVIPVEIPALRERLEDVPRAYVTQFALYRAVLGRLYPGKPIRAVLVWTEIPILMEIPAEAMDGALARLNVP